ncbi:MAG: DUF4386 domain-containing protein [Actinobacteria bacterium HGW-Actinobacteria-4]|nr:MAG: DUF4386 domain-containing protein [Actinobacteria bacterium HGW-Actinobacteria-4]
MNDIKRTARITGLAYLGLAITGMVGFLLIRSALYVDGDSAQTLANLVERESFARLGVAFDFGIVITQALAALWFFKLFRRWNPFAAGALAAFGMVNAIMILVGVMFTSTALHVALNPASAPGGDQAGTIQLLVDLSNGAWSVSALFFGLWLIPMGYVVDSARLMPRALGAILMVSGGGYILSAFAKVLLPDAPLVAELLPLPATVGEFWILGYLLIFGVRASAVSGEREPVRVEATA